QKLAELNTKVASLQQTVQQQEASTRALQARSAEEKAALEAEVAKSRESEQQLQTALAQRDSEVDLLRQQLAATETASAERLARAEGDLQAARTEQERLTSKLASQQLASRKTSNAQIAELEKELQAQEQLVTAQRSELDQLQGKLLQAQARLKDDAGSAVVAAVTSGPTIEIIDPPLLATRGTPQMNLRSAVSEIEIIGRVESQSELLSFKVDDQTAPVESNGLFRLKRPVSPSSTPVNLVAIDQDGQRTALEFLLNAKNAASSKVAAVPKKFESKSVAGIEFGNYYALVIGNNDYPKLTDLNTAENDARVVAGILENKYGFNTRLLINADRYTMLSELNKLRETLTEKDNLLIYYAGHGELDKVNLRGYWLPVDSEPDSSANWISNVAVTDILNVMSAKHILVVADSCYSGSMTRSSVARLDVGLTDDARKKWYRTMNNTKARSVLTSGGVKPVLDGGGGEHSIFAKAFIEVLNENDGVLEGFKLYRQVQERVKSAAASLNVEQEPQYAPIKYAGHEAGEFFLLPGSTAAQTPEAGPMLAAVAQ
ncbi:MAG: caspase family protein, partial [Gammaproteobacteria bacterium]|nr:caspase family protein [Gammaproteobacteria bacterium]